MGEYGGGAADNRIMRFHFRRKCGILRIVHWLKVATVGSRTTTTVIGIVVGCVLLLQGAFTTFAKPSSTGARTCCCRGCDSKHCSTPACCAKPAGNRAPSAPAAASSSNVRTDWQALPASAAKVICFYSLRDETSPVPPKNPRPVPVVPLFQRNCSYLL